MLALLAWAQAVEARTILAAKTETNMKFSDVAAAVVGPYVLDALGPLSNLAAWLKANPNADKAQALGQLDVFLAQERLAVVQGGAGSIGVLATIGSNVVSALQSEIAAKIAAATAAVSPAPAAAA